MNKKILCVIISTFFISTIAWAKTPPKKSLSTNMQQTGKAFSALLPYLYDYDQFVASNQRGVVLGHIESYSKSIHSISPSKIKASLGDDPLANLALRELKGNVTRALNYFRNGQHGYSRKILKSTTSSCFSCHTRIPRGKTDYFWKNLDIKAFKMKPTAKAQLYVAMRKYPDAKAFIRKTMNASSQGDRSPMVDENLIYLFMFITLRGQDEPKEALAFLESQIKNKGLSDQFRKTLMIWKKDLQAWSNTKTRSALTVKSLLGLKGNKVTATDHDAAVKQILASRLLHIQLQNRSSKLKTSQAYLYLGQVYDHLIEGQFWELPELYFEACIENAPGQAIAQACFEEYKENITAGFTGTRGTEIPQDAQKKIKTLKALAFQKAPKTK